MPFGAQLKDEPSHLLPAPPGWAVGRPRGVHRTGAGLSSPRCDTPAPALGLRPSRTPSRHPAGPATVRGGGGPGHGWCQGPPRGTANPRGPGPGAGALPSNAPSGLPSKNRPGPAGLCPFNSRRDAAGAAPRRRPVSRAGVPPPTACK